MLLLCFAACQPPASPPSFPPHIPIPAQADWVDYGPILTAGAEGEWDHILWGGFAATAVKHDGTYYLYYQGSRGYQIVPDETVTWRAIGVATRQDGVTFAKYQHNPILTWTPNDFLEEGAVSSGVTISDEGEFVMYYGANTQESATSVNADGRLATSTDGFSFVDAGLVLNHRDRALWGSGDELFPIVALTSAGRWFVYYLPNGRGWRGQMGVAWGDRPDGLTQSAAVKSGSNQVIAWGTGGQARVGPDLYALFLSDEPTGRTEVRLMSLEAPQSLSMPVQTYQFDGVVNSTVLLDEETRTWFMYSRSEGEYRLRLAPAGELDTSPPTTPRCLTARPVDYSRVDLAWEPAEESDTGVVVYVVYRDGLPLTRVNGLRFSDSNLASATTYRYEISAVNFHGVEGERTTPVSATTLAAPAANPP